MGFESFKFWPKPKPENRRIKKKNESDGISRREFFKRTAVGAGLLAMEAPTVKKFIKGTPTIIKWANRLAELDESGDEGGGENETAEQREIFEEDAKSLDDILNFKKKGKIDLNLETAEQVKNYWKERYSNPQSQLSADLKRAYADMGEWMPYLEDIFEKEGVPKEYAYLAIPESHWRPNAVSPAKAAGPYQFMKETAKIYHLRMDNAVDERKDPLKSAQACAQNLKYLYDTTGDWRLALSGYNGGKIWEYLKEAKETNKDISYENFLEHIEEKINWIKSKLEQKKDLSEIQKEKVFKRAIRFYTENLNYPQKFDAVFELIKEGLPAEQKPPVKFANIKIKQEKVRFEEYDVKRGDTLFKISRHFGFTPDEIKRYNKFAAHGLKAGAHLNIPANRVKPITLEVLAQKNNFNINSLRKLNPALARNTEIPDGYEVRV